MLLVSWMWNLCATGLTDLILRPGGEGVNSRSDGLVGCQDGAKVWYPSYYDVYHVDTGSEDVLTPDRKPRVVLWHLDDTRVVYNPDGGFFPAQPRLRRRHVRAARESPPAPRETEVPLPCWPTVGPRTCEGVSRAMCPDS